MVVKRAVSNYYLIQRKKFPEYKHLISSIIQLKENKNTEIYYVTSYFVAPNVLFKNQYLDFNSLLLF